jgi:Ala-tRNA(Pro) deacylase
MSIPRSIKQYLFHHSVSYSHESRSPEVASVPAEFVKTLILLADGRVILTVIPEDHVINLDVLKQQGGWGDVLLVSEREFGDTFPSCQPAAIPPLGKLFGVPLYCDSSLAKQAEIEFNAGTTVDTVRMTFANFIKLEDPIMLRFSEKGPLRDAARPA